MNKHKTLQKSKSLVSLTLLSWYMNKLICMACMLMKLWKLF